MKRRWRHTQPLRTFRHSRFVDRLQINSVLPEQEIACRFANARFADHYGKNMRFRWKQWQAGLDQSGPGLADLCLMPLTLLIGALEMTDGSSSSGRDRRRECRRENKSRRIGAHRIDHRSVAGDIPTDNTEGFRQRAFDHVD